VKRSSDRILTTHPGRLPDPTNRDAVMQARERDDRPAFDAGVKAGVAEMIAKQRTAGVDIMSDGEFWKARDQKYYGSRATGIESKPLKPGEWPSTLGTQRERTGPEFRQFYEAYDRLGNTPRPGLHAVQREIGHDGAGEGPAGGLDEARYRHDQGSADSRGPEH